MPIAGIVTRICPSSTIGRSRNSLFYRGVIMQRSILASACAMLIALSGCANSTTQSSAKSELDQLREEVASLRTENARLQAELNGDRSATAFKTAPFQLYEPLTPKSATKDEPQYWYTSEYGIPGTSYGYGKTRIIGKSGYGVIGTNESVTVTAGNVAIGQMGTITTNPSTQPTTRPAEKK